MALFNFIRVRNLYINRPDTYKLGEALREMVEGLKKAEPVKIKELSQMPKIQYPLKRDSKGRICKP